MSMTLGQETVRITHINENGDHVVGLIPHRKLVIGIYVSSARDVRGREIKISGAKIKIQQECPPKFYKPYKITEIGPYESNWSYAEIDVNTIIYAEDPPFIPVPISVSERRKTMTDMVRIGSVWANGKDTWVVRDLCTESLMGKTRQRVWITTPQGKRGQAIYLESLISNYYLTSEVEQ